MCRVVPVLDLRPRRHAGLARRWCRGAPGLDPRTAAIAIAIACVLQAVEEGAGVAVAVGVGQDTLSVELAVPELALEPHFAWSKMSE